MKEGLRRPGVLVALVLVGAFVALLAYGIGATGVDDDIDVRLGRGETPAAPGFELPVLAPTGVPAELEPAFADGSLALGELRGTPVVLNFWASWCPPCRTEAPLLEETWRDNRDDVLFLGLNMQDLTGEAREFLDEVGNSYPHVRDDDDGVARDWGATGLPETFFITPDGRIVGHVIGAVDADQLEEGIAAATAGRVSGAEQGGERREIR
ncbi:MAG: TlpA disulfide reductase family protein [Thermoleophilaceae bacterium]